MKKLIRTFMPIALSFCMVLYLNSGFQQPSQRVLAANPCTTPSNSIVSENCKAGNPASEWDINGIGDTSIQGFATDISYNRGQTVNFKIQTNATQYRLDIYRMGYYGGQGARKVDSVSVTRSQAQNQPNCLTNGTTGLIDCGNWSVSASWPIPVNATSGIYFAKVVRLNNGGASHIVFIVRDDASTSDILFQTSDTTWQAYNNYGGNSLYTGSPAGRAYKVSYNRPFNTRVVDNGQDWLFNAEYPMVRWLEANGYNISYFTGVDSDRFGDLIPNHKVFLSVGHDEYWSKQQRDQVEAARNAGVHLAFFSGNEVFWKTRWENSLDSSGTSYRTLVCYKETKANAVIDPQNPPTWTGTWRDPRFSPPADGGLPENALTGTIFKVNGGTTAIKVPADDGKMRFWRNTNIANLTAGSTATLTDGTLGYEWDEDIDNGFRPPGLIRMSTTTVNNVEILQDYGSTYGIGTAIHHLTLYKHSSGALVFGSGTIQWPWGLDGNHDRGNTTPDVRMQQATVNLFADMGVQPATLQSGLVQAFASSDIQLPTSAITFPTNGASVQTNTLVTIIGTASETGGGVVGGVEVSVDGGTRWHPANGRANWSYSWQPTTAGTYTIKSRAVDDSGNIQTPETQVTVTVGARCSANNPCITIWDNSATPSIITDPSTSAVELGVKFRSQVNGYITGMRFYKGLQNTGTHEGTLWSNNGTQLARATFINESASGWQQVNFSNPVEITANTTYVASYHTNVGRYSLNEGYFASFGVDSYPLYALRNGESGGNGVYAYNANPTFPTSTYNSSNYWVDVVFNTNVGLAVTTTTPNANATGVSTNTPVTATFNKALDPATINTNTFELRGVNNALVAATVSYNSANNTATLTPSVALAANTTYTATVKGGATDPRVKDQSGNALAANVSWSFTTNTPDTTPPTVTSTTPTSSATGVSTSTTVRATFSEAIDTATINTNTFELRDPNNTAIPATVSYDTESRTAILTPSSPLATSTSYTATVKGGATGPRVKDQAGNALAADFIWSFTTSATSVISIWDNNATPAVITDPDISPVELGVKFRSDVNGYIKGIKFYKSPQNTNTHVGTLWNSSGQQLAQVTFTSETASGWQQANFNTSVAINANTVYVVSYHTSVGKYSVTENYFTSSVDKPPLHALANGVSGGNGVYTYSAGSAFPTSSYAASNYWVDVLFSTTP
ncbi:N,N-dimethylformamidase beta subunit family domain-containing protein [Nostoc sp. CCY0012]|uniref:N,N-dimethylformamidase beta subunit family domain-containing protein n=1 Tax=Nostoc sp. CCY0012 TaxID=1056123 RepID=UPI0039C6C727